MPGVISPVVSFHLLEAIKAVNSLKALSEKPKEYPIDLTIGDGKIVMANPDDKGQAELVADVEGQVKVRIDGQYLAQALKACGSMVDFKLTNGYSPTLFSSNGYKLVVMPMLTTEANEQAKTDRQARSEQAESVQSTEPVAEAVTEAEAIAEAEPVTEHKPKRNRKREAVAVA